MRLTYPSWLTSTIIGCSLASLFADCAKEVAITLLPTFMLMITENQNVPSLVGLVGGIAQAASHILKPLMGALADRLNVAKPLIAAGYFLSGLFSALIGLTSSIGALLWCQAFSSCGQALREPPRDGLIAITTQPHYYGRAFGFQRSMDTAGSIIGLTLLYFLRDLPIRTLFLMTALPGLLATLSIIIFVPAKPINSSQSDEVLESKNTTPTTLWPRLKDNLSLFGQLPSQFGTFLIIMCIFSCGYFSTLLLLLRGQEGLSVIWGERARDNIILLYLLFTITRAIFEYISGRLSDSYNKILILASGCGLFGLTALGFAYQNLNLVALVALFCTAGISIATITALERSYAADILPANHQARGYGVMQMCMGICQLFANAFIGLLWSRFGVSVAMTYSAAVTLCAAMLLMLFSRKNNTFDTTTTVSEK